MKFRNYCIVVMGTMDSDSVKLEIEKIAESKINVLDAKGLLIATFTSAVSPKELTDWFKLNDRNFLLFDLNEDNSGFSITKKDIHEGLFGFLSEMSDKTLKEKTNEFLKDIKMTYNTKNYANFVKENRNKAKTKKLTKEDIKKMTIKEKQELQDKIIDNGVENMTDYDKEILSFLWI